jgi:hypothetical protein
LGPVRYHRLHGQPYPRRCRTRGPPRTPRTERG